MRREGALVAVGVVCGLYFGACGGATAPDGGSGGQSDASSGGETSPAGGQTAESGGGTSAGGTPTSGGAESGGASSGGADSSSGGESLGGSGGSAVDCDCGLPDEVVCGVDGNIYNAVCGESCVPVDIACEGICPCPGPEPVCGCSEDTNHPYCENQGGRTWVCDNGGDFSSQKAEEVDCTILPTGAFRICCPEEVEATEFCED